MAISKINKVLAALKAERDEAENRFAKEQAVICHAIAKIEAALAVKPERNPAGRNRRTLGSVTGADRPAKVRMPQPQSDIVDPRHLVASAQK